MALSVEARPRLLNPTYTASVTESMSTPRLRATHAIYLALIAATAVVGPRTVSDGWYYTAGALGYLLVALACLGRIWASAFIAGHKDAELVTAGPYALCRHPLYACSMLGALGLGLTTRSVLLCAIVVTLIAALVVYAASGEEQFLADAFPEEFNAYVLATPNRWWPRPRRTALPEQIDVRPVVFWKAFLDAGSFFLLYLLVALAAEYRLAPTI
jgi:protein-S-isoprenylcysteine O-methyltransferase Ste14